MRQVNFVLIFAIALALVLFSLENTQPVSIQFFEGIQVQAPLAVELILAMGIGAVLAWFFSVWTYLHRALHNREEAQQIHQRDDRIQELEQNVARYKAELEERQPLLPAGESLSEEAEPAEAYVQ